MMPWACFCRPTPCQNWESPQRRSLAAGGSSFQSVQLCRGHKTLVICLWAKATCRSHQTKMSPSQCSIRRIFQSSRTLSFTSNMAIRTFTSASFKLRTDMVCLTLGRNRQMTVINNTSTIINWSDKKVNIICLKSALMISFSFKQGS